MAKIDLGNIVAAQVTAGLTRAAAQASNDLKQQDVAKVAATVTAAVLPDVEKEAGAIVQNMTNQEPLYLSRNFWTFVVILVAAGAGIFGYTISADDQSQAVDTIVELAKVVPMVMTGVAAIWGLWNRIFVASKKPLGQ